MASTTWHPHHEQDERLARLRGAKMPATSPGARGIEHVQRNPAPQRAKGVQPCLKVDERNKLLQQAVGVREAQVVTNNRLVGDR